MTLGLNQHLVPSAGGGDDGLQVGGPDERFGIVVVLGEVAVDRGLEIDQRVEYATLQAAPGELGEEALDGIELGRRGRREVEGPARVASEPGPDLGMLVAAVVVEHDMDQLAGRDGALEAVEEAQELLVAVALHALPDHPAVEHVQGGEQGRGVVADVVVGHRAGSSLLHRQAGLVRSSAWIWLFSSTERTTAWAGGST